jgi:hypothetical protein
MFQKFNICIIGHERLFLGILIFDALQTITESEKGNEKHHYLFWNNDYFHTHGCNEYGWCC